MSWGGSWRGGVGHTGVGWDGSCSKATYKMIVLSIKILPHQNHFWKGYKIQILNIKIIIIIIIL